MEMFLYKVLIGATPKGRHTEQHDVFFGIANSITALVPQLKLFWPEAAEKMHVDAFRKVTKVGNYTVQIVTKENSATADAHLFFINLGGYKPNEFDEFHYKMIVAAPDKGSAIVKAKETSFYKHTGFDKANSHVDDKYGIDVDDAHAINDILTTADKAYYKIILTENPTANEDTIHLGYFILSKLEKGIIEAD